MKIFPFAIIIGALMTSCRAMPGTGRVLSTPTQTPTPTHCVPPYFTMEMDVSPNQPAFNKGDIFSISVDQGNSYRTKTIHLIQEGIETPVTVQGATVIYPGNWGAVEVLPESGNKKFILRALAAGTVVFHAELSADMPAFDSNCLPITSMTNIRSNPIKIVINPTPTAVFSDTPAPTSMAQPSGKYACEGHENGLIAAIGWVVFNNDGGFLDQAFATPKPGISGTWHFEPDINLFIFSDNIDFAFAGYLSIEDSVILYLRPGITRAHAEDGNIQCSKAGG